MTNMNPQNSRVQRRSTWLSVVTQTTPLTAPGSLSPADYAALRTSAVSKSSKQPRDPGGSDLSQLPYCHMRPSVRLAVKPTNWWLRSNLNAARTDYPRLRRSSQGICATACGALAPPDSPTARWRIARSESPMGRWRFSTSGQGASINTASVDQWDAPTFDYKMIDGTFMLAPVAAAWLLDDARGQCQIAPFGTNVADADESNAAQSWSTVYLAIPDPGLRSIGISVAKSASRPK
jgi:hypothetical protein